MSLQELESAVTRLEAPELAAFARWFDEFVADAWDRRIEADVEAGRLDEAARQADADFDAGSPPTSPPWAKIYDGLSPDEVDRLDSAIRQRSNLTRASE